MDNMLERLIKSRTAVKVMGVALFCDGLHLREIARRAGTSAPQAKRELDALAGLGVLARERKGSLCIYRCRKESALLADLKGIYLKTEGVAGELAARLWGGRGISRAFLCGGLAGGQPASLPGADLVVVGAADEKALAQAVAGAQEACGRQISYLYWSEGEYARRQKENGAFFRSLATARKAWLAGEALGFG